MIEITLYMSEGILCFTGLNGTDRLRYTAAYRRAQSDILVLTIATGGCKQGGQKEH